VLPLEDGLLLPLLLPLVPPAAPGLVLDPLVPIELEEPEVPELEEEPL
jgi:hypothetical protein